MERPPRPLPLVGARAIRELSPAALTLAALAGAWLVVAPRSPDLAAQAYRTYLFSHFGMLLWDNSWYGGHAVLGYSILYPPLSALLGLRTIGVLAVLCSTLLFGRIATLVYGPRAIAGTVLFAVAAAGDLWIGRTTFALGVSFALAATLVLVCSRRMPAVALSMLLGALSVLSSPVAGALLALALATDMIARRRLRPGAYVIATIVFVLLVLELLFPEGGFEPYGVNSFAASTAVALGFIWALPKGERLLRTGGWLFMLVNLFGLLPTPLGSNVVRYAVLLAGPLLLCALCRRGAASEEPPPLHLPARMRALLASARLRRVTRLEASARAASSRVRLEGRSLGERLEFSLLRLRLGSILAPVAFSRRERRPRLLVALVLAGIASWVVWGPVTQSEEVLKDPSTNASFYQPVRRFIKEHTDGLVRIEVPFTRSHWESALLAPYVSLARGWERQLDKRYDESIEEDPLRPSVYHAWLQREGVAYVALPDVPFDGSSLGEVALIRRGAPFLKLVFETRDWKIYEVLGARALAEGPGRLVALGHQRFALRARSAGRFLVRVRYTPYWTVVGGSASIAPAGGAASWTEVTVRRPGLVRVQARFSLSAALKQL